MRPSRTSFLSTCAALVGFPVLALFGILRIGEMLAGIALGPSAIVTTLMPMSRVARRFARLFRRDE